MLTIHVGINNKIKKINDAISLINEPTRIILDDKDYYEKVIINKDNITIDGNSNARIHYDDYALKIHEDGREYVTFRTYTLLVKANNVTLNNLTIENTSGEGYIVGQAVALHLYGDNITLNNVTLLAKQDTLFLGPLSDDLIERYTDLLPDDERFYDKTFTHTINNTTIAGTVDFIFGGSNATFNNCTIISLKTNNDTYIVAPNHKSTVTQGFVFNNCKLIKDSQTRDNSVYLARPWRDYGFVTFRNCYLDSHIKEQGFSIWEGTDRHLHARFFEENSYGPGKSLNRISWSHVK